MAAALDPVVGSTEGTVCSNATRAPVLPAVQSHSAELALSPCPGGPGTQTSRVLGESRLSVTVLQPCSPCAVGMPCEDEGTARPPSKEPAAGAGG